MNPSYKKYSNRRYNVQEIEELIKEIRFLERKKDITKAEVDQLKELRIKFAVIITNL